MSNCDLFVFGRTKTIDYRWLLKPKAPLSEAFFSRTLEYYSQELGAGKRLFASERRNGYCVFSTFYISARETDERGRPIAFAVGLTCPESSAREFNYRLPDLILHADILDMTMADDISAAVRNDALIISRSLDISMLTSMKFQSQGLSGSSNGFVEGVTASRNKTLRGAYLQATPVPDSKLLEQGGPFKSVNSELIRISDDLRSSVDTPMSLTNYDVSACGFIIAGAMLDNQLISTGSVRQTETTHVEDTKVGKSLLEQADALLENSVSRSGGTDGRSARKVSKPKPLTSEDYSSVPAPGTESDRFPGILNTLGAVFGALSGSNKRERKDGE
jgi:hypothetical protein